MKSYFLIFVIFVNFLNINWTTQQNIQTELSEKLLRLHVIASSDSKEDQTLKLFMKDKAIEVLKTILSDCDDKKEAISIIQNSIPHLTKMLQNFTTQTVTISLEHTYFPVKCYGDLIFPAGFYDALRIVLDKGEGQNWWCVLYPPLCFTDLCTMSVPEDSKTQLQETISDNAWDKIQMKSKPKIRFWIVDFIKDILVR